MISPFFRMQSFDSVNSTNLVMREAAQKGEAEGLVIHAKSQTAGMGRRGRSWESPEGNLYISVLLRPACEIQKAGLFSFVAAMAIKDTITRLHNDDKLSLKWPNDVLMDSCKVSGILIEAESSDQQKLDWLIVGVGINVAHAPEQKTLFPATSLKEQGVFVAVEAVQSAFLHYLHHWYRTFMTDGFEPIRRAWLSDAYSGTMVVHLPEGDLEGHFGGLTQNGSLILRLADGTEKVIHAGDVSLL